MNNLQLGNSYACVDIELFSDNGLYRGKGDFIRYARIKLNSKEVSGVQPSERKIDLIVNSIGYTKAEKKIRRYLIAEKIRISADQNLSSMLRKRPEPTIRGQKESELEKKNNQPINLFQNPGSL